MIKKFFNLTTAILLVFMIGACSGGSGFNKSTCEELQNKITNHEELSDSEISSMIDQMYDCAKEIKKITDPAKDDPEKMMELKSNEEIQELGAYILGFGFYLESHAKDLSPDNVKKLMEMEKKIKELDN